MNSTDRELLARLAPEHQEAFALLELEKAKRRHALLKRLEVSRKRESILLRFTSALPIVAVFLAFKFTDKGSAGYLIGALLAFSAMGAAENFVLNRKVNALIELLEEDLKKKA